MAMDITYPNLKKCKQWNFQDFKKEKLVFQTIKCKKLHFIAVIENTDCVGNLLRKYEILNSIFLNMVLVFKINRRYYTFYEFLLLLLICGLFYILFVFIYEIFHHLVLNVGFKSNNCEMNEPIDVVYTWVNGSDTKFQEELQFFLRSKYDNVDSSKKRFDDKYELKFSLRSLEKYAPWINHVYIVTNGQIPYWLNLNYEKVSLISHEDIFKDPFNLPTFSSPAIESNLHRIPGLSKKFIYFNDDIFLGSPVYFDDFYAPNKGFLVYLAWPVPACSSNCPWMYVNDGQCDKACLNANCQMDGEDCSEENIKKQKASQAVYSAEETGHTVNPHNFTFKMNNLGSVNKTINATMIVNNQISTKSITRTKLFLNLIKNNSKNFTHLVDEHNKRILIVDKLRRHKSQKFHKMSRESILLKKIAPDNNIDAYSASLQHTNRVFNNRYGFKSRKVPSHAPILIDKEIMQEMQTVFEKEFEVTEKNRIRKENDMQYSFSYYYYLMSEMYKKSVTEIFDEIDTDSSGTWSDREIRTLLTKLYELPLSYAMVEQFEEMLTNCSNGHAINHPTPSFERYIDSDLPTITKDLVVNCDEICKLLMERLGESAKYKFHIVSNAENKHVSFKMLNSNINEVVNKLDEIRNNAMKFVCLNDNLDESEEAENELIRFILYDFYYALFPHPSKFELPEEYSNKFLYINELNSWKKNYNNIKFCLYAACITSVYVTFYKLFRRKFYRLVNKLFCSLL